jgi:pimeloyl-ACP methyl ester carboxylesterase
MPLPITPVHPEGPRYRAPLIFVPGLWSGREAWRRAAGLLAHRGWEGWLADPGGETGGIPERAAALAAVAEELGRAPVLVALDAAGVVALEVARRTPVAAVVWVAPFVPGGAAVRAAVSPWRVLAGIVLGAPVGRPGGWTPEAAHPAWIREQEAAALVVDVVRGRTALRAAGVPTALVVGEGDPRCTAEDRAALCARLDADLVVLPGAAGLPLAIGHWQEHAGVVHRWLVRRLGETVLELYEEAMAERDAGDDE